MTINIALVEDDKNDADTLFRHLQKYKSDGVAFANGINGENFDFKITNFDNALKFFNNPMSYDIVFMDIQMPHMNGMEAAKKLREIDHLVKLVFITNMANFAIHGYEVDASDFVVKPVSYLTFSATLTKLLKVLERKGETVVLKLSQGIKKVPIESITYVEVIDHQVYYHTTHETIEIWGTLKEQEGKLPTDFFARCNNCFLVNLKYVREVGDNYVDVFGKKIPLSRPKKKNFMQRVLEYHESNI